MTVLETKRLRLRKMTPNDAAFMLRLLNEPSFIQNIADRGVRTLDDARQYIQNGPMQMYMKYGFGLNCVEIKDMATPIGMCGLLKRDTLSHADIGYAYLPEYWSKGYALEAAAAMMAYGKHRLGMDQIVAIVSPGNESSIKLLHKLGLQFERTMRLAPEQSEVQLFVESRAVRPAMP
jgi:RimJ/RimL family protein N-acetyltransferase